METDLQLVRQLLSKMNSDQVNEAQKQLLALANTTCFVQIILTIMRNTHQQHWIKTVAASFLNQVYYNNSTQQNHQQLYQSILNILTDPHIKQIDKRCFEKSIIKTLQTSPKQSHLLWQERIYEFMQKKSLFDSAYLLLACLAVADIPEDTLRSTIYKIFDSALSSLEVCIENANLLNQMMKMWIVIVDKLKQSQQNAQILFFMANSQKMLTLIELIYEMETIQNLYICMQPDLYELNMLKYEAAELHKRFVIEAENNTTFVYENTLDHTKKTLPKIALTLLLLAQHIEKLEQTNSEDFAISLVSIYHHYVAIHSQQFSYLQVIKFINMVVFPLIRANDQEREKFEESPEQFNSLAQDCCDKQTYGILKTETLKLLQTFGDRVPGCMQFSIKQALLSLKTGLGFISHLPSPQDSFLDIETSLIVLSLFSYEIGQYPQQIEAIRVILCDKRTQNLPPLELSRVFTFLAYNYGEIFKNPVEGEQWISLAANYRTHPTTSYTAYDFLSNLVEDYFNENFIETITQEIVRGKIALVWEVTAKILENHYKKISAKGILTLIGKLYLRVNREIELLNTAQKDNTLDLINCLRVFSKILVQINEDDRESIESQGKATTIIAQIWPILQLFNTAEHYNIEEEILKIASDIVDNLPLPPPQLSPLLQNCLLSFKKDCDRQYIVFFNQILIKADFNHNLQLIVDIMINVKDAFLQTLMKILGNDSKLKGNPGQRKTLTNLMIVLQTVLLFGQNLLTHNYTEFFLQVSSLCIRLLPNSQEQMQKTSSGRILISRAFNTLMLCHMHLNMDRIFDYLKIIQDSNAYHGHDTKVIVMCLCKEILKQQDFTAINLLLTALLIIVNKSEEKDSVLANNKKKGRMIKTAATIRKINQFDRIFKYIDTPFDSGRQPKQEITQLLTTMKTNNYQSFRTIVDSLSAEVITLLKSYIDLDPIEIKKRVIRKIIGIKEGAILHTDNKKNRNLKESMDEDSDEEQFESLKRQRVRVKAEGKDSTKTKQKKNEKIKRLKG